MYGAAGWKPQYVLLARSLQPESDMSCQIIFFQGHFIGKVSQLRKYLHLESTSCNYTTQSFFLFYIYWMKVCGRVNVFNYFYLTFQFFQGSNFIWILVLNLKPCKIIVPRKVFLKKTKRNLWVINFQLMFSPESCLKMCICVWIW